MNTKQDNERAHNDVDDLLDEIRVLDDEDARRRLVEWRKQRDDWWRAVCWKFALVELDEAGLDTKFEQLDKEACLQRFGGTPSMIIRALAREMRR